MTWHNCILDNFAVFTSRDFFLVTETLTKTIFHNDFAYLKIVFVNIYFDNKNLNV